MPEVQNKIHRIIYLSSAVGTPETADLDLILSTARKNNAAADVTGLLLYNDGCFFQVLEGPVAHVKRIFDSVRCDPRHHGVIVLEDRPQDHRAFGRWAMGYADAHAMTTEQRDSWIDLSELRHGHTDRVFTHSKSASLQIDTFLNSFREFARA